MPRYIGLVVHGIGEQECGSQLKDVGAALADLVRRSGLDPDASLRVAPAQEPGPAWAEISLRGGHTIRLEEVWWARCFQPPSVQRALGFWVGAWLRDPLGLVRGTFGSLRQWRDVIFLQRLIAEAVAYAAVMLLLPLAAVLWFLSVNPIRRFLPKAVQTAYQLVANVLTRHVGDLSVYLDDAWEAARIQEVFACRLNAITAQEADERFVIAHSMGAVVTYEGLLRAARENAEHAPVRFIAVGAALNRARRLVAPDEARRLEGPLPAWARLTYIAARHDPATLGGLEPPWEKWAVNQPESLEVVNQQDIFSDHTTYWSNAEEVMAPILRIVSGGRLSIQLRKSYRRLRVTVLAALKGVAWLLPAAVFVWMATTGWSSAFAAWAYGKAVLQTPVRLITAAPQTGSPVPAPPAGNGQEARAPDAFVMAPLPGALLINQQQESVIGLDAESGGEIDRRRAVTGSEPFAVDVVIEAASQRYQGYRYSLTWDPEVIAIDDVEDIQPEGLTDCAEPDIADGVVSGQCFLPEGVTDFVGAVTTVQLHCIADGESDLQFVVDGESEEPPTALFLTVPIVDGNSGVTRPLPTAVVDATIFCQASPTATPTPRTAATSTPTAGPAATAAPTATATATPTLTLPLETEDSGAGGGEGPLLKPWDQPNDFLDVFGGRWTLAHLALPLLASAYVAVAAALVYNLLVKTAWDIWDRRTKFRPATPDGSTLGSDGEPEAPS